MKLKKNISQLVLSFRKLNLLKRIVADNVDDITA